MDLSSQTSSITVGDMYSLLKILHDIIFPVPVGGCDTCPGRQRNTDTTACEISSERDPGRDQMLFS